MFTINCNGRLLLLDRPVVMGIINCTPDSFYKSGRTEQLEAAINKAAQMVEEGATIIDVGGQSTRPGSLPVSDGEEMKRVVPVIKEIRKRFPTVFISVDTYQSSVARMAAENGADLINDISGGTFDEKMLSTVADLRLPFFCMHIKGKPLDMQKDPVYENVCLEILDYFIERMAACKKAGITDIILDPGLGFGKAFAHNFEILKKLEVFRITGKPLLIGISRKGTIYKTLNISPEEALNGTTVLNTVALMNGANILRVHDVKQAMEAVKLCSKIFE